MVHMYVHVRSKSGLPVLAAKDRCMPPYRYERIFFSKQPRFVYALSDCDSNDASRPATSIAAADPTVSHVTRSSDNDEAILVVFDC